MEDPSIICGAAAMRLKINGGALRGLAQEKEEEEEEEDEEEEDLVGWLATTTTTTLDLIIWNGDY